MKKRLFLNILAVLLLIVSLTPAAYALETNLASGTCGEGLSWSLDGYTLTISGSGAMDDGAPWQEYKDHIEHVVLTGGVTKVGASAFYKYDRIETVDFGDALVEIGEKAFYGCEDIDYIHLPSTFRSFGAQSFRECTELKFVYCDGGMPRFNDSCLWTGNYIAVFYPTNNPWPAESVNQLVHNFGGRLGIMMGNFDQSAVEQNLAENYSDSEEDATEAATEATETPTEAPTEAATEPVVVAAVTEPVVVETTEAPTEAPAETTVPETTGETTVPTTAEPETTEWDLFTEPTEAEESPREKLGGNSWIGIVMIAGVLTFLLAGAMIFRSVKHKGGRYRN